MIKNLILILVFTVSAMSSVAWSQSTVPDKVILTTEGNAAGFTPAQKDFLQATMDDLCKIGSKETAEKLNKQIAEKHATIGEEKAGTLASTKCPFLGYLDPISSNNLNINQQIVDQWASFRERAAKFQEKGNSDKEKTNLHEAQQTIRDMAFTLMHEEVHMDQYAPEQIPKDENPAYETTIREERRVINEDMQKIREIQGQVAKLPGDQDRLNELIEDLEISREVYQEKIDSMQSDVIEKGIVDPEKFKTSKADMDKLFEEAGDLIKSVGIKPVGGPFEITKAEYPSQVTANGDKGSLTVYWSGDPVFPIKVVYRPRSCSESVICTTPEITFNEKFKPLVFPEAVWCAGSGGINFDYEVVIIDARGIESMPYPAPFYCNAG